MSAFGYGRALVIVFSVCGVFGARSAVAQMDCRDTPEGRVCAIQQPIIQGALAPVQIQRDLGLITVAGGCSGTLLNRYWVLTADHCVASNGRVNGPSQVLTNLPITAAWSADSQIPTRLVRNWGASGLDVALIYLGAGDFGPTNIQLMSLNAIEINNTLVKYGRGISAYATPGPPPTPAAADGQYRTATFTVSAVGATTYTLPVNAAGQVGNGGDSGGPDILLAPNGVGLGIAGVQSTCVATGYVPGQPSAWMWATGVSSCNSAPIESIRYDIIQIAHEAPVNMTPIYYELL